MTKPTPKRGPGNPRPRVATARLNVPCEPREKAATEAAAAAEGSPVAAYVREAVRKQMGGWPWERKK
jgi:hypothetical protein